MSNGGKRSIIIVATIAYSSIWFTLLFIIVGFFIPTPVAFYRSLRRRHLSSRRRTRTKSFRNYTIKDPSKYGLSDDPDEDELMFYETIDD